MANKRNWMKISVQNFDFPLSSEFECISIDMDQAVALGSLMDSSYQGTIDHEGETLEQCIQEMKDTMGGKYGAFIQAASFAVTLKGEPVSAILLTEWKGQPLVAYTMTKKDAQGKGLAKFLLGKSIAALVGTQWKELFLVVTEGNLAAEKLYENVGFKKSGQALPGRPPPVES